MEMSLIIYDLNNKSRAEKTRIVKVLFGYKDKSYHGKYEYQRPGILSRIKYERRTKTALLVAKKDQEKVVKILKQLRIAPIVAAIPS